MKLKEIRDKYSVKVGDYIICPEEIIYNDFLFYKPSLTSGKLYEVKKINDAFYNERVECCNMFVYILDDNRTPTSVKVYEYYTDDDGDSELNVMYKKATDYQIEAQKYNL